jgi:putative sugar O-methyltransferase
MSAKRLARSLVPPLLWELARRIKARAAARPGHTRPVPWPAATPATSPAASPAGPSSAGAAADEAPLPIRTGLPEWDALTRRTLEGLATCDPDFRPTTFWGPGLRQLLQDMSDRGLASFKSWPTSKFWFYPMYGCGFTNASIETTFTSARAANPAVTQPFFAGALSGSLEARRDFDAARLAWNHGNWLVDLDGFGESRVGAPPQYFRLAGSNTIGWGRPYLNYLLCMAALSQHVSAPPKSFVEIGGGFGVLGEIVMSRDPQARYVNLDIPPLLTVSSYYLTELFGGDRVLTYADQVGDTGPIEVERSACLPNWRIEDLAGPYEVFVNSFSFQEMEPHVVERYVAAVASVDVRYVVSLNSKLGKPKASSDREIGVIDPVTSDRIVDMFGKHGYELRGRYGQPLIRSAGELVVLARS